MNTEEKVDTKNYYMWYALIRGYVIVEYCGGCYELPYDYVETHTKEEIAQHIENMNEYYNLVEMGVFDDE